MFIAPVILIVTTYIGYFALHGTIVATEWLYFVGTAWHCLTLYGGIIYAHYGTIIFSLYYGYAVKFL